MTKTRIALIGATVLTATAIACGTPAPQPTPTVAPTTARVTTDPTIPATTRAVTTAPPTEAAKKISAEQQNAIETAESYLSGQSFSRKGLIDQLKYEGYPAKIAAAAVDSLHIDWNAQAEATAKNYLDGQSFSRKGLIDQLVYEGFTKAQATYGVGKAGL